MLELIEFDRAAVASGGPAVVLLHGWGDSAEAIAGLAPAICPPRGRVVVPDGPLPHPWGGRGWWDLEAAERPAWAGDAQLPAAYQPNAGVLAARQAVLEVIEWVRTRYEPESVALAGFSQGAMLAADVGLHRDGGVAKVAVLSGVLLADSMPALLGPPPSPRPQFLLAHGQDDEQVPFRGGLAARDLLRANGYQARWLPFSGGHDVPREVAEAVQAFLAA